MCKLVAQLATWGIDDPDVDVSTAVNPLRTSFTVTGPPGRAGDVMTGEKRPALPGDDRATDVEIGIEGADMLAELPPGGDRHGVELLRIVENDPGNGGVALYPHGRCHLVLLVAGWDWDFASGIVAVLFNPGNIHVDPSFRAHPRPCAPPSGRRTRRPTLADLRGPRGQLW